ncbi:MAG: NUMOD4 motif-containing HNH endonuclease [Ruminococcus sp.]
MSEIWKPIPGYEGYYEASTYGRVRSVERIINGRWRFTHRKSHIMTPNNVHDGYKQVKFSIAGKKLQPLLHRLIAETFIPNPDNLPQVNHIDGNKDNNNVDNLEWCTASQNSSHRSQVLKKWVGRPKKKVKCIETGVVYESSHHASRELKINQDGICSVCQGRQLKTKNFHFEFVE